MKTLKTTISTNYEVLVHYEKEKGSRGDDITPDYPDSVMVKGVYVQDNHGSFTLQLDNTTLVLLGILEEIYKTVEEHENI